MSRLIVVDKPGDWPLDLPGAEVVAARDYLTGRRFLDMRRAKVFNLCRTYRYQSVGYYVSLLATARGHKPLPSVTTFQGLRDSASVRIVSEDLEEGLQRLLAPIKADRFELSVYFGRNLAKRYDRLSQALFDYFPAPFLRAEFARDGHWHLRRLRTIAAKDIPESHWEFVIEQATRYFARPRSQRPERLRYDLAILVDPDEAEPPSDERAIQRFVRAARRADIAATIINKQHYGRLAEFDALFIRAGTLVTNHTYRFASRAAAEGMVVIDDPESIVRCTNKVYQAELFHRHSIPCPDTMIVHKDNVAEVGDTIGFPCVLKRPDSAFSQGVVKADDPDQLQRLLEEFFRDSELVVAQRFVESSFDWRVGVLSGQPLYACRYHMARGHWQVQKAQSNDRTSYGKVDTLAIEDAPTEVVQLAIRAATHIGDGLYGVDIKDMNGQFVVMEVNDNPSIEAGCEDAVMRGDLYLRIMQHFYERLEERGRRS